MGRGATLHFRGPARGRTSGGLFLEWFLRTGKQTMPNHDTGVSVGVVGDDDTQDQDTRPAVLRSDSLPLADQYGNEPLPDDTAHMLDWYYNRS